MRKFLLAIALILLAPLLDSHEFWLEPAGFQYKVGDAIRVRFKVGENFEGDNWTGNRSSVGQLKLYYKNVDDNLVSLLPDSTKGDSLTLQFFDEGTMMITYESTNKFIRLPADSFLMYLKEDGLQNAINYRSEHGEMDSVGKEFYRRSVKTIFQVGAVKDNLHNKRTGLPLDIIPMAHPYSLKKGEELPLKFLFKGAPLPDALVKAWHRLNGKTTMKDLKTDAQGQLSIPVSLAGRWMVSTVRMERELRDSAQWQSYWGSLTWGYE
jgi:uncharacterized GH25 family protein